MVIVLHDTKDVNDDSPRLKKGDLVTVKDRYHDLHGKVGRVVARGRNTRPTWGRRRVSGPTVTVTFSPVMPHLIFPAADVERVEHRKPS